MINNPPVIQIENSQIKKFDNCNNDETILVANTPIELIKKNEKRAYAAFVNLSNVDITLNLGSKSKAAINKGIVLKPAGSFCITQINLYTGAVFAISNYAAKISFVECFQENA